MFNYRIHVININRAFSFNFIIDINNRAEFTYIKANSAGVTGSAFDPKEQYNTVRRRIPFCANLWGGSDHVKDLKAFCLQSLVLSSLFAASFQGLQFVAPKSLFLLLVV
jgi:hypothetical protein